MEFSVFRRDEPHVICLSEEDDGRTVHEPVVQAARYQLSRHRWPSLRRA